MEKTATTTKVEIPMDKEATIKANTNKKQIPHNQVETEP